jgi:serine/threonine protein kinase
MATRKQPKRTGKQVVEEKPTTWQGGPPEIVGSEIKVDKLIGEGSFGKVYSGTCRGSRVAIKVPLKKLTKEELQDLRQEVAILSSIYHPNVVLFMGACTREEDQLMIVTELKDCTVEKLLKEVRERKAAVASSQGRNRGSYFTNAPAGSPSKSSTHLMPGSPANAGSGGNSSSISNLMVNPTFRLKMARDTALGTNWLHNISHIIHRDLKTANLLYDENSGRVCVTDFGLSQALAPQAKAKDRFGPRGSALFMAPEVIREEEFDHRVDTYSFGIILWELWTCEEPFADFYDFETFVDAVHVRGMRPPISSQFYGHSLSIQNGANAGSHAFGGSSPTAADLEDLKKTCPPKLVELIKSCWSDVPSKRPPDFETILHTLDEIVVELAMSAPSPSSGGVLGCPWPLAATFWFESFCKDDLVEKVSWNEFVHALDAHSSLKQAKIDFSNSSYSSFQSRSYDARPSIWDSTSHINMNEIGFDLLAPFLLSSDGKYVSLTQFADVVEWFGHWYDQKYVVATLIHVHAIVNAEWFAGAISRQVAESHINSKSNCPLPDSFLVRLSASFPGCPFTITRPSHSTRRPNLRVKRIPSPSSPCCFQFVVDYGGDGVSASFASLPDLIQGLQSDLRLVNPAPPISSSTGGY